ncbi:hypothetical protein HYC85_027744 [Camellia sinensis]|uniref:Uncharacterized protein n=1 Tax=Camellia sinensis TaxID=4442 RepID=A0A7J7FT55_CAMSI|nr:hypothetical protein HYC85_027744 [Camellia sinensis]
MNLKFLEVFIVAHNNLSGKLLDKKHNLGPLKQAVMKEIHLFVDCHWRKIAQPSLICHTRQQQHPQTKLRENERTCGLTFSGPPRRKPMPHAKGHVSVITKVASAREIRYERGRLINSWVNYTYYP